MSDDGRHVYEAAGSHFGLRVAVADERSLGVWFRVEGPGCRSLEYEEDNDLYPVTGPKFAPVALEMAQDYAAWIRALAERRLLVGCRRGGMTFTLPLKEERLFGHRGRILETTKRIPLDDDTDDFSDLVPVQVWPAAADRMS